MLVAGTLSVKVRRCEVALEPARYDIIRPYLSVLRKSDSFLLPEPLIISCDYPDRRGPAYSTVLFFMGKEKGDLERK